jgi:hypothetical protein
VLRRQLLQWQKKNRQKKTLVFRPSTGLKLKAYFSL